MIPVIIALIIVLGSGSLFFIGPTTPEEVYITLDVAPTTTLAELENIIAVFDKHNINATIFLTSNWAHNNTNLTQELAINYEIACLGVTGTRLALLEEEDLREEILGCQQALSEQNISVLGFRAYHRDISQQAHTVLEQDFLYDSSTYQKYTWFWEKSSTLNTQPISSAGLIPLDDRLFSVFKNNNPFYFISKQTRQEDLTLALNTQHLQDHLLALDYLLAYFVHHNTTTKTLQEQWS